MYTLYGMAASLYTARARSYMRTQGVPFKEIKAGSKEYLGEIVPQIGRWIIPVIKTPEGAIIQDGADIIDHLDGAGFSKAPIYPEDPKLLAIAHLFELFGQQGLLRQAMHYRWNFDEVNLPFIRDTFRDVIPTGTPKDGQEAAFLNASGRMRKATTMLGVNEGTAADVEASYHEFLALMNAHLEAYPFLLGGHPTIADYGLIGSMYAHLGRDPKPLHLMQTKAPRVFRWVERMNMPEVFEDEAQAASGRALFDGDALPDTLAALMRFVADEYLPEITAHVAFANDWLDANPEVTTGTSSRDPVMRGPIGLAPFQWRGREIQSWVLPYRFYLLGRLQAAVEKQAPDSQTAIRQRFAANGLETLLDLRTKRPVHRADNQEVWGELIG